MDKYSINVAIGADIVRAGAVAGNIGVAHRCGGAELDGRLNTDILAYGEHALSVFDAAAGVFACGDRGFGAAFCHGGARFRKRRDRYGNTNRRELICHGGAGLIFVNNIRDPIYSCKKEIEDLTSVYYMYP